MGKENCLYIHVTLVPYLKAAGELKTKPTQHSVGQLRQIGIQPDVLICRTERPLSREDREKIALFCNVPVEAVIEEKDKDFSIYEVPLSLVENALDDLIVPPAGSRRPARRTWTIGTNLLHRLRNPQHEIAIAVVGKYAGHRDAYKSIYEALDHAGIAHQAQVRIQSIQSEAIEHEGRRTAAGGLRRHSGSRRIRRARHRRQSRGDPLRPRARHSVVRHLPGNAMRGDRICPQRGRPRRGPFDRVQQEHAASGDLPAGRAEVDHRQRAARCGSAPSRRALDPAAALDACYGRDLISERHRHRYEFNNVYRQRFEAHGMLVAGDEPRSARWSKSSNCRSIRGSWPCNSIPNSNRSRPRPIRCSPASSPRPSSATPPANGRRRTCRRRGCRLRLQDAGVKRDWLRARTLTRSVMSPSVPVPLFNAWRSLATNADSFHDRRTERIAEDHRRRGLERPRRGGKARRRTKESRCAAGRRPRRPPINRRKPATSSSAEPAARPNIPPPPATLEFLITTLATQAMMSLGQIGNPVSGKADVRLPEAKHFIDMLTVLEEKTAGNRTADESALLDGFLHELRMAFVLSQS